MLDRKKVSCIVNGGEFETGVLLGAGRGISCVRGILLNRVFIRRGFRRDIPAEVGQRHRKRVERRVVRWMKRCVERWVGRESI